MKKLTVFILSALVLVCFSGCGESKKTDTNAVAESIAEQTQATAEQLQTQQTTEKTPEKKSFRLGFVLPENTEGEEMKKGAQLAVQKINAKGAIKLEISFADEGINGENALQAYTELEASGAQAVAGAVSAEGAKTVAAKSSEQGMLFVSMNKDSSHTEGENIIDLCDADNNKGIAVAEYISSEMPTQKVAVFYRSDDENSKNICNSFTAEAESRKIEIVYSASFTKDTAYDFANELSSCQQASAQIVLLLAENENSALIAEQAEAMGYSPIFMGADGFENILSQENFKKDFAKRMVAVTPFSVNNTDNDSVVFTDEYTVLYGAVPTAYAAYGYDAVTLIAQALELSEVKSTADSEKICKKAVSALKQKSADLITGSLIWDNEKNEFSKVPEAVVISDGIYAQ